MMMGVVNKFVIASMYMFAAPIAILYGFNHNLLPGSSDLSSESTTLWSGILAVISVNVVIAFYIYMAMKDPLANSSQILSSLQKQRPASSSRDQVKNQIVPNTNSQVVS